MASAAFERFRFSFFEDETFARDGLATLALAELRGEEITQAEELLIGFLPDARGVIGLGILRSRRATRRPAIAAISALSTHAPRLKSTSATCSISSGADFAGA
jgi:hypothetical protein